MNTKRRCIRVNTTYVISIPNVVGIIGRHVLFGEKILNGIELPQSVKTLNGNPFVPSDVKSFVIPNTVEEIYNAFAFCKNLEDITIPSNVTTIGKNAFAICFSLRKISIPGTVQKIDKFAFFSCPIEKVEISEGVKVIEPYSFYSCYALKDVVIPKSVVKMGEFAFENCFALRTITVPKELTLCCCVPPNCEVKRV